jgi:hypothetical protein
MVPDVQEQTVLGSLSDNCTHSEPYCVADKFLSDPF